MRKVICCLFISHVFIKKFCSGLSALLFYHPGNKWHLGMNLNPSDGHIMDYTTGWDDGYDIGNANTAFTKDYLSKNVWDMPVNFIGIVRHQNVCILYYFLLMYKFQKKY